MKKSTLKALSKLLKEMRDEIKNHEQYVKKNPFVESLKAHASNLNKIIRKETK
jgi:hypothetical protein